MTKRSSATLIRIGALYYPKESNATGLNAGVWKEEQIENARVYPEVSGMAAWSENCKWYSSLPLDAVVLLICESV
jgi:hypothetical protein